MISDLTKNLTYYLNQLYSNLMGFNEISLKKTVEGHFNLKNKPFDPSITQ